MSYDLCEFEECFFTHPLSDSSSIDTLKAFQENNDNFNPLTYDILDTPFDEIDQIAPTTTLLSSSSSPCHHLQSLSINQMGNLVNSIDLCPLEIKTEESQLPFRDSYININSFLRHSYGGCDNSMKIMQRRLIEASNLEPLGLTSPDHGLSSNHIRRVCSTGDLHRLETRQKLSSSPLATEGEANFKVGRYSPEERKERILRYKAKRTQRNFNKTIKYACRKTLADNRPRIRGRFARNDEPEESNNKTFTLHRYIVDEDELWMKGLQEEYYKRIPRGLFFNTYIPTAQFHQCNNFRK